jgi:hypothetical protein
MRCSEPLDGRDDQLTTRLRSTIAKKIVAASI